MQPYQYKPLPSSSSIRVLILYPETDTSAALECDLITKNRLTILRGPDSKTFDAVSYVWGSGAHDIPLYCRSEATCLFISAVVDGMLRTLRKGYKEKRLWVDALCLNQKDNDEKSIQVQQMGQIYHMADKVHIWLGPAVATTPLAFAYLKTLVAKFEPTPSQAKNPTTEEILDTFEEIFEHRNFQPILELLQNPWFTRRWTLQEGFLARDAIVRCGGSKIPWHWFTEGLNLIYERSQELQSIKTDQSLLYSLSVLKTLQKPTDLLSLLWILHMSHCSDPRDRIYSLLGLAQNNGPVALDAKAGSTPNRQLLVPDYALSTDVVYRRFASYCITTDGFLQILLHIDACGRLSEIDPKWPSWVPNWTRARHKTVDSPKALSGIMPRTDYIDESLAFNKTDPQLLLDKSGDGFSYARPTEYHNGDYHGIIIHGELFEQAVEVCDHGLLFSDLSGWINEALILCIQSQDLKVYDMRREVESLIELLITGSDFFWYAEHSILRDAEGSFGYREFERLTDILYPIAGKPMDRYTFEQVRMKEHLDLNSESNLPPNEKDRQKTTVLLDRVKRMIQEGRKAIVVASFQNDYGHTRTRHWIAPDDFRIGDAIVKISYCGRVGVLLRPNASPPQLEGRATFQFIGILWSLGYTHDIQSGTSIRRLGFLRQPKEFLIL